MAEHERVEVKSVAALRQWLQEHHQQSESIWLVTWKKHRPEHHVSWDDIVRQALCFGWIDSQARKLDGDRKMQRLSPRKPGSHWSARNKKHLKDLEAEGLMMPAGQAVVDAAKADGSWTLLDDVEALVVPDDLAAALDSTPGARGHFEAFTASNKKTILWWIKSAKRQATRQTRIEKTARLAGMGLRAQHPESKGVL